MYHSCPLLNNTSVIWGNPKTWKLFIKYCVFVLTCFKLQSPSKHSPFDAVPLGRHFFHCLKQFLNLSILMPFSASAAFFYHLCHIGKTFPFEEFVFICWEKSHFRRVGWIRMVGHKGNSLFGQKLLNTQHGVGRCAHKSPIRKWANMLKESSEKNHWSLLWPLTTPAGTLIQMGS